MEKYDVRGVNTTKNEYNEFGVCSFLKVCRVQSKGYTFPILVILTKPSGQAYI